MDAVSVHLPIQAFLTGAHRWMAQAWSDTHRFKVLIWHRRARKTTMGLNRLIVEAATHRDETYFYVGPTYRQAKATVLHDPQMLARYLPREALASEFNRSELFGEFHSGSKLFLKGADDPDSLRGIRVKGAVLDEFAMMKPEILQEILLPTIRETGGWLQLQTTPKGKNHAFDLYRKVALPGYEEWSRMCLPVSESRLFSERDLASARAEMGEELYRQEMECCFLDSIQSVFRGWEACVTGELEPPITGRRYVMGVDLGRYHDATVLSVMDCARRHLVAWQRLTENHWALQKQAIASLAMQYHSPLIRLDSTGVGSPIEEDLRELGLSVEGITYTERTKRELIDGLRIALAQRLITFPRIDQLVEELQDFEMRLGPTGQVRYGAPEGEGYFDDAVNSLALAVSGLKSDLYVSREAPSAAYEDALAALPANGGIRFR